MSEYVGAYMRLLARSLIDKEENQRERDDLRAIMSAEEEDAANRLVAAIFGEWIFVA
jgi:hypothetical protein